MPYKIEQYPDFVYANHPYKPFVSEWQCFFCLKKIHFYSLEATSFGKKYSIVCLLFIIFFVHHFTTAELCFEKNDTLLILWKYIYHLGIQ